MRWSLLTFLAMTISILCAAEDPAYKLLRAAFESRYTWDSQFPGFRSEVRFKQDDKSLTGSAVVSEDYRVSLNAGDEETARPMLEMIQSMVEHRRPTDVDTEHKGGLLRMDGKADDPRGALIVVQGDALGTAYRVKDGRMTQIVRNGKQVKLVIDMLEWRPAVQGKFLPGKFRLTVYKPGSDEITATQEFADIYTRVGGYYLPKQRVVVVHRAGTRQTTMLAFERHELLK